MNELQKNHLKEALKKGIRLDGRSLLDFRPISIEKDVVKHAEGSVKITCGDTILVVGVKLSIGTPFPDRPKSGALMVNAEMIPLSHPSFEPGPPGIDSIEYSRVIDRGIRESKAIDEEELCVVEGEKVWIVNVDIYPVNYDGNMIDIGGLGAITALYLTKFPKLNEDYSVDYKEKSTEKLPLRKIPIPITVVKVGNNFLVDPTEDEKKAADSWLTVTTLEDGTICSLQKGGDAPLTIEDIKKIFEIAIKKGNELRELIKKII